MSDFQKPSIGQQGRYAIGSDCYPITVVYVSPSGKTIRVQHDSFRAGEGHDYFGAQKWIIERNLQGRVERFDWSPSLGCFSRKGTGYVRLDGWRAYQDPSF